LLVQPRSIIYTQLKGDFHMLQSYRELVVWQKAMELATLVYRLTESFPKREIYGLVAQLRRAGVSVPSNIAEGYGRGSRKEYVQFLSIAQGSLKELETQILSEKLAYATAAQVAKLLSEAEVVGKMLGSLIRSLKARGI
jgi:four helix bundle protein